MTPLYYYAPIFEESCPGQDGEEGVEQPPDMPIGMNVLKYDGDLDRCVVQVPYGTRRYAGWLPKHSGEVLTDYPNLPGVE